MKRPDFSKMEKIAPGVYLDGAELHLNLEEFLPANGYPCTPQNERMLEDAWLEIAAELMKKRNHKR